ncbi:MAG: TRAP transporter large permease subunit [Deinococcota bacterium]
MQETSSETSGGQSAPLSLWVRLEHRFTQGVQAITALLLLGIVLVITYQVLARYLPGVRIPRWTEEISLIMMVWLSMLGSGLAVRKGEHLAMDVVVRLFPKPLQKVLATFVALLVVAFGVYLVWFGGELVSRTMGQTFSATKLPIGLMYLGLPLGGFLIALYSSINMMNIWRLKAPQSITDDADVSSTVAASRWTLRLSLLAIAVILIGGSVALFGIDTLSSPVGVLLGSFALLLVIGVPIAMALGLASLATVLSFPLFDARALPPLIVAQRMANGINSTPLLAIPFFILAGQIMAEGGIAQRFVDFARVLVGPLRGGLAMVNIVASMLFGGASGSSVADVSANGSILIPMMDRKGYDTDFSVGITVASSTQGLIIPPSHNAVIYSLAAGGVSIGALFLGGYIPGIMIGLALMVASYILATRRGYPSERRPPLGESTRIIIGAIPSLAVGFIIVGGIAFGFFTATEAAAIGAVTAFLVATLIYRELTLAKLWRATLQSVRTISIVILLIASASAFAWLMAYLRIPTALADGVLSVTSNPYVILLIINVLLLLLGAIMDMSPLILILTPVLLPIVSAPPVNMSPVHFGIVLLMNLGLGLTTPPVGTALFVGCAIGKIRIEDASKAMVFLWPVMVVVLLLVTYVPWFVTVLPNLLSRFQ